MNSQKQTRIKAALDELYESYCADFNRSRSLFFQHRRDPVQFPHRYNTFHDIEASAFLAATFAYGNVTSLCTFIERLLSALGTSPHTFLMDSDAVKSLNGSGLYYRLHKEREITGILRMLSAVYREHESLYNVFLEYYRYNTMKIAISKFVEKLALVSGEDLAFLVPSPQSGSPCKRLMLFLRWMVRRDGIDFGLWKEVTPASLIMPVDTHIGRAAFKFGWIKTPSLTWQKAEEITAALRKFDPVDPTRYDFSLCHESMKKSNFLIALYG